MIKASKSMSMLSAMLVAVILLCGCNGKQENSGTTSNKSNANSKTETAVLFDCSSSSTTPLTTVSGITTKLYFAELNNYRSAGEEIDPVSLSLADYADEEENEVTDWSAPIPETTLKNDIFFDLSKTDGGNMPGYAGYLQICNADNKSIDEFPPKADGFTPTSANSSGASYYIHGGYEPPEAGLYRVDAYLYTPDGQWQLVGRLDDVQFTE
ncbi:MAG: hypothetical protein WC752_00725 [Patescibacteria group bacterium]|jgi:hypothetical protein